MKIKSDSLARIDIGRGEKEKKRRGRGDGKREGGGTDRGKRGRLDITRAVEGRKLFCLLGFYCSGSDLSAHTVLC